MTRTKSEKRRGRGRKKQHRSRSRRGSKQFARAKTDRRRRRTDGRMMANDDANDGGGEKWEGRGARRMNVRDGRTSRKHSIGRWGKSSSTQQSTHSRVNPDFAGNAAVPIYCALRPPPLITPPIANFGRVGDLQRSFFCRCYSKECRFKQPTKEITHQLGP